MTTNNSPDVQTLQLAERISALLEAIPSGDAASALDFLADLVQEVADDEELTTDEAVVHIAQEGEGWMGGRDGRISVCVRSWDGTDEDLTIEWGDGTWCALGQLLDAVENERAVLDWYDSDWVEVQDELGHWVQRDVLAARDEE